MAINVYIDNNVWDLVFEQELDLAVELPQEEFCLLVTREVEFEIAQMPHEKNAFVKDTIARCNIRTDAFFGFASPDIPPNEQRTRGFGGGRFASPEEQDFIGRNSTALKPGNKRPTGLFKNEADLGLAARAVHSIVLSRDTKKSGPIRSALAEGSKIVSLIDFATSDLSLREFIFAKLASAARASTED